MKKFGLTTTPFAPAPGKVDIPEGDPRELNNITDQFMNSAYGELFNVLAKQGITPASTTASDLNQLNRAIMSIQMGSNLYNDTGTAAAKLLTHKSGTNFLYKTSNVLQNAFCLRFVNSVASNGTPVTITIFDAANAQNLPNIINIPFVKSDGSNFINNELAAGDIVDCFYDLNISKFKLLMKNEKTPKNAFDFYTGTSTQASPDNYILSVPYAVPSLTEGMRLDVFIQTTNLGPSALNFNGLGPITIYRLSSPVNLVGGDLLAGTWAQLKYSVGANGWILLNPAKGNAVGGVYTIRSNTPASVTTTTYLRGVTYTNTTGAAFMFKAAVGLSSLQSASITVDGVLMDEAATNASAWTIALTAIVPAGSTFVYNATVNTGYRSSIQPIIIT